MKNIKDAKITPSTDRRCEIILPANLLLKTIEIIEKDIKLLSLDLKIDILFYYLHIVYKASKYEGDRYTEEGFVKIPVDVFKSAFSDYKPYLTILIEKGLIERDGFYIRGEKAYGYRILTPYGFKEVKVEIIYELLKRKMLGKERSLALLQIR